MRQPAQGAANQLARYKGTSGMGDALFGLRVRRLRLVYAHSNRSSRIREARMNRKGVGLIVAGLLLMLAVARIFNSQSTKGQHPPESGNAARTTRAQPPFRTVVLELTFRGRSLVQGEVYLTETGRRIEYIDAVNRRRREDFERDVTTLGRRASTDRFTLIFDGRRLYTVRDEGGTPVARTMISGPPRGRG